MELYRPGHGKKTGRRGVRRSFRNSQNPEPADAKCADCGKTCTVPFVPRDGRPVYCSDCFRDRPRSGRQESRGKRPKEPRLLKRQSLYSGGSEKFYDSLKEKLFEILGGKVCSGCGFRDERALGFGSRFDDTTFDAIGRGGAASSWAKYISDPGLARDELQVLCLNCNQIRQRPTRRGSPAQKKSRFPR